MKGLNVVDAWKKCVICKSPELTINFLCASQRVKILELKQNCKNIVPYVTSVLDFSIALYLSIWTGTNVDMIITVYKMYANL